MPSPNANSIARHIGIFAGWVVATVLWLGVAYTLMAAEVPEVP